MTYAHTATAPFKTRWKIRRVALCILASSSCRCRAPPLQQTSKYRILRLNTSIAARWILTASRRCDLQVYFHRSQIECFAPRLLFLCAIAHSIFVDTDSTVMFLLRIAFKRTKQMCIRLLCTRSTNACNRHFSKVSSLLNLLE